MSGYAYSNYVLVDGAEDILFDSSFRKEIQQHVRNMQSVKDVTVIDCSSVLTCVLSLDALDAAQLFLTIAHVILFLNTNLERCLSWILSSGVYAKVKIGVKHLGLFCLLTGISSKNGIIFFKSHLQPLI